MSPSTFEVVDAFRDELLSSREAPTRRRGGVVSAVALLLAAGVVVWAAMAPGRTASALAVERSGDVVSIRLRDAAAGPWQLTQELRADGVKARVLVAPVTPEAVGTWVQVQAPRVLWPGQNPSVHDDYDEQAQRRLAAERVRGVEIDGDVVRIPADHPHEIVLVAGVEPRGEQTPVYDADGPISRLR